MWIISSIDATTHKITDIKKTQTNSYKMISIMRNVFGFVACGRCYDDDGEWSKWPIYIEVFLLMRKC